MSVPWTQAKTIPVWFRGRGGQGVREAPPCKQGRVQRHECGARPIACKGTLPRNINFQLIYSLERITAMGNINEKKTAEEKLVPMTIRTSRAVMDVIEYSAELNHVSKATIIRLCIDNRLTEYLKNVDVKDEVQAAQIHRDLYELNTKLQEIKLELRRIGINYNQEVRLMNIRAKYPDIANTRQLQQRIDEEDEAVLNSLDKSELNEIMHRFTDAIQEAGEKIGLQ